MRIFNQVICVYLICLIGTSFAESDCFSIRVSSMGCETYRATSPLPGRPCLLTEKTIPGFTIFLKPDPDFKYMEIRVNADLGAYYDVQYGSEKLYSGDLMQRRNWNEIALRTRTTTNYEGKTWKSYFLEVNGHKKDISDNPAHTVAASNFQILISGSTQWSTGCGQRPNIPISVETRPTHNSKATEAATVTIPDKITEGPVTKMSTISIPTTIIPTKSPILARSTKIKSTLTTPVTESTSVASTTSPKAMFPTEIQTSDPATIPTATTPTTVPILTMTTPLVMKATIPITKLSTESSTIVMSTAEPTILPTLTMETPSVSTATISTIIPVETTKLIISEEGITGGAKETTIPTVTSDSIVSIITTNIIEVPGKETMTPSDILKSTTKSPTTSAADTSTMHSFTSISLSSAIMEPKYLTTTDDYILLTKSTTKSDNIDNFTRFSSALITRILSTIQSEEYSSSKLTEATSSLDILDDLVTSPLLSSEKTVTTLKNVATPRTPKLIISSSSSEVLSANGQSSFETYDSNLPLPLWQMITYAAAVDIAIVILALCIFIIVYRINNKHKEKRLQEEIDHVAFSEYIKRNLQPTSTEADANSLYGMSGRIGPGANSEREELTDVSMYGLISRAAPMYGSISRAGPGIDRFLEAEAHTHRTTLNESDDSDG